MTKNVLKLASESEKDIQRIDEATAEIVTAINYLLLNAQREGLTTITSILRDARESIAWWAAHDNYNESGVEKIYHRLTCESELHTALNFLARFATIKDDELKEDLLQTIEQFQLKSPVAFKNTRRV